MFSFAATGTIYGIKCNLFASKTSFADSVGMVHQKVRLAQTLHTYNHNRAYPPTSKKAHWQEDHVFFCASSGHLLQFSWQQGTSTPH
jgi:hypothetical protein